MGGAIVVDRVVLDGLVDVDLVIGTVERAEVCGTVVGVFIIVNVLCGTVVGVVSVVGTVTVVLVVSALISATVEVTAVDDTSVDGTKVVSKIFQ